MKVIQKHKKEIKDYQQAIQHSPSLKYPPLKSLKDYAQSVEIQNQLTYRLGEEFLNAYKFWWCGGLLYFLLRIPSIKAEARKQPQNQWNQSEIYLKELLVRIKHIEAISDIFWTSKLKDIAFRGQLGQDALAYVLNGCKKEGFFVDIGAHNGLMISNSYLFEQIGWKGICVEANPNIFANLERNRKCDVYNLAVFSKNIGITRMAISKNSGLNTLEINLTEAHKRRMEKGGEISYVEVQTATFNEIMAKYPEVSHIDFMSLDVEGGELEVLKGIDFDKYTFGCIAIEHNYFKDAQKEVGGLLKSKGYRILMWNGWDYLFVRDEKIRWNW